MSVEKRDFFGKEVTDAIKEACKVLNVPQEELDIEVLETGSTGIFGLIRKKARIRVSIKEEEPLEEEVVTETEPKEQLGETDAEQQVPEKDIEEDEPVAAPGVAEEQEQQEDSQPIVEEETDASPESLALIKEQLSTMIELMGYPSEVSVSAEGLSVQCDINGEHEEALAGHEGKTLDSIQYLLRKIVARKCEERIRLNVNVGDYRERRLEELKKRAIELSQKVKESGKTHVLPALNPSERREIHMILQEDKEVRSRSVGDGLFKKILIYKPGKNSRSGKKKGGQRSRGRRGRYQKNTKSSGNE